MDSAALADTPVAPGIACRHCGWVEAAGSAECRSCGSAMSGSAPVLQPVATLSDQGQPYHRRLADTRTSAPARRYAALPVETSSFPVNKAILALGIAGGVLWLWSGSQPVVHAPGILLPEEPLQSDVPAGKTDWMAGDSRIRPLALYQIKARVLHTERYRWDAMSDLAPLDLGVGWGVMSDQANTARCSFSNTGRFLTWSWAGSDFPEHEAVRSVVNMHMLPANDRVRDRLLNLHNGQLFQASGYLVEVQRPGMHPWTSSLTRLDTGNGACEIMWVENLTVLP